MKHNRRLFIFHFFLYTSLVEKFNKGLLPNVIFYSKASSATDLINKNKMLKKIVLDLKTHPAFAEASADCYCVIKVIAIAEVEYV